MHACIIAYCIYIHNKGHNLYRKLKTHKISKRPKNIVSVSYYIRHTVRQFKIFIKFAGCCTVR